MVPLAIGLLLGARGGLKKLFFAGCAVLIRVGVIATFSRGGFIGLVCVSAVLAWRLAREQQVPDRCGFTAGAGGFSLVCSERLQVANSQHD